MTTISLLVDENDNYTGFICNGHAGYSKDGSDIVCSAISVLTINFINSIDELTSSQIEVDCDERSGYMRAVVEDYLNPDVVLLFKSLILGLKGIEQDYSKYLKLTNRRYKP